MIVTAARAGAVAATVGALLAAGCTSQERKDIEAFQQAGVNRIAQEIVIRPGIECAFGILDSIIGTPPQDGALVFNLTGDGTLSDEESERLVIDVARDVWRSDLGVSRLSIDLDATTDGVSLQDALDVDGVGGAVGFLDLEAEFGPKQPRPSPLPEYTDPGNPECFDERFQPVPPSRPAEPPRS